MNQLDSFVRHLRSIGRSERTVEAYNAAVRRFNERHAGLPTSRTMAEHQAQLMEQYAPSTVRQMMAALRSFADFLKEQGETGDIVFPPPPKIHRHVPRVAPVDWVEQVLRYLAPKYCTAVLLMFDCGLRISEVTALTWDRIDTQEATIIALRKGGDEQMLPIPTGRLLANLIENAKPSGYVVAGRGGSRLARGSVNAALNMAAQHAGLPLMNPHALRHGFSRAAQARNVSTATIQQMLNHSSLQTTQQYLGDIGGDVEVLRMALAGGGE